MLVEVAFMRRNLDPFNKEDDVKTSSISTRFCIGAKNTINSYISGFFSEDAIEPAVAPQGGGTIAHDFRLDSAT